MMDEAGRCVLCVNMGKEKMNVQTIKGGIK